MFLVSLQILGFNYFTCVVRYVFGCLWFPTNFRVLCCVLFVMCWMFMVSLQILGFSVACCSLCVGCLWFPANF
jgi:hypothetical protein